MENESTNTILKGIGASSGVAMGRAYLLDRSLVKVVYQYLLEQNQIEPERERVKAAADTADSQLNQILEEMPEEIKE